MILGVNGLSAIILTQKTFNFIILKQIKTWKDVIPMQPDKSSYLIEQILHQTQSRPFSHTPYSCLPKHDICLIPPLPFRDGIFLP